MAELIYAGSTSQTIDIFIADSSSAVGAGLAGLVFNTASLTAYSRKGATGTSTAITLATQTVGGAYSSGGFVEIDATNQIGMYRFDIPNALIDTSGFTHIVFQGAANMAPTILRIDCRAPTVTLLTATQASIDAIEADSNELQTDDIPGAITVLNNLSIADVGTALATYDGPTNTEMVAAFTEIKGVTWDATNTLEAIVDRGDSAWVTATGFSTLVATDIVSNGAITTLSGTVVNVDLVDTTTTNTDMRGTDGANTTTPDNVSITAILTDTGTSIPALIATAQADLDTITGATGVNLLAATQASIDAIEADTNELQTDWVDGGRLDVILDGAGGGGGGGGSDTATFSGAALAEIDAIKAKTDTIGTAAGVTTLLAASVLVTGTITAFPSEIVIGDSYTTANGRAIQIPIVDTDGLPIASTGTLNFADANATFVIQRVGETDTTRIITGTATFVDPPGTGTSDSETPYASIEMVANQTAKGLIGYKYSGVLTFTWPGTGSDDDVMSFETATIQFDN